LISLARFMYSSISFSSLNIPEEFRAQTHYKQVLTSSVSILKTMM
jgi:hypothetical protein